jgi:hypothetical protein
MGLFKHLGLKPPASVRPKPNGAVSGPPKVIPPAAPPGDALAAPDGGGIADDAGDLERDLRDILQNWSDAAIDGVGLFTTTVLSKRIDDLESGSWTSFFASLIGNIMWAAAAFVPAGGAVLAFRISVTGIGVAALPTIPSVSKNTLPELQKLMQEYVYSFYNEWDRQLNDKARNLIESHPGIGRYRAIAIFVGSFKPEFSNIDETYATIPTLAKAHIRDAYFNFAEAEFDRQAALQREEARRRRQKAIDERDRRTEERRRDKW